MTQKSLSCTTFLSLSLKTNPRNSSLLSSISIITTILTNFNGYYNIGLKRSRNVLLERAGVFVVEGDINNADLQRKLFDVVTFTHVMHLAAQAGVMYAMGNSNLYVRNDIDEFVNLLEVCKSANPQPATIWASSSSVYGLNSKVPFSEKDPTNSPTSLYAATKKERWVARFRF